MGRRGLGGREGGRARDGYIGCGGQGEALESSEGDGRD